MNQSNSRQLHELPINHIKNLWPESHNGELNHVETEANNFRSVKKWFDISPMRVTSPGSGNFLLEFGFFISLKPLSSVYIRRTASLTRQVGPLGLSSWVFRERSNTTSASFNLIRKHEVIAYLADDIAQVRLGVLIDDKIDLKAHVHVFIPLQSTVAVFQ